MKQTLLSLDQINELQREWRALCEENFKRDGDRGTCVLGAGLVENGIMVVSQHDVSCAQGCSNWEYGLDALLKRFNAKHGVVVTYYEGRMD